MILQCLYGDSSRVFQSQNKNDETLLKFFFVRIQPSLMLVFSFLVEKDFGRRFGQVSQPSMRKMLLIFQHGILESPSLNLYSPPRKIIIVWKCNTRMHDNSGTRLDSLYNVLAIFMLLRELNSPISRLRCCSLTIGQGCFFPISCGLWKKYGQKFQPY